MALKIAKDEASRLMRESANDPTRTLTLTIPGGKLKRIPQNQWAFELVAEWRQQEVQALLQKEQA